VLIEEVFSPVVGLAWKVKLWYLLEERWVPDCIEGFAQVKDYDNDIFTLFVIVASFDGSLVNML
jgi:hypothetical protein